MKSNSCFVPLSQIVKVKGGKRLPKGSNLQDKPNTHPYIRVRDMGSRYIPEEGLLYVPDDVFPGIKRYIVEKNDVIISIVGTIGLVSVIQKKYHKASLTENCAKLIGLNESDSLYLYYYLTSEFGQQKIKELTVGAVQPKLPLYNIEKIQIPWPDSSIRENIVSNISILDDKIANNNHINQTLEEIAQALFKSWFVDFEPVLAKIQAIEEGTDPQLAAMAAISGKTEEQLQQLSKEKYIELAATANLFPDELVESELGLIPKGWKVLPIGELANNESRKFDFRNKDKVVFLNTGDVLNGRILHNSYSIPNTLPGQAKKAIKKDDILFSEIRPINRRFAYVKADLKDHVVSTKFMIIKSNGKLHPRIVFMNLKRDETIEEFNLLAESRSGTFPQITFDTIKHISWIVPSSQVQESFVNILLSIVRKQDMNELESQALISLRNSLLPKLLSGEFELADVPIAAKPDKIIQHSL